MVVIYDLRTLTAAPHQASRVALWTRQRNLRIPENRQCMHKNREAVLLAPIKGAALQGLWPCASKAFLGEGVHPNLKILLLRPKNN
jgi:hypothetical protein